MHRVFLSVIITVLYATIAMAANSTGRSSSVTSQTFSIDGVACPEVLNWSGGDAFGTIVISNGTKHIANIANEPITIETVLPLSPPLAACVADLCANSANRRTLQLTNLDSNGAAVGAPLLATNAQLTEARFPAFDSSSKDIIRVFLVFVSEQIRPAPTAPASPFSARRTSPPYASNFQLTIAGLNSSRVSRIEPFIIKRTIADSSIGVLRGGTPTPSSTEFPDLSLNFNEAAPTDWAAWRDDFFINGKHLDADEKDGSLQILGADQRTVIFTLKFSHIGLLRFSSQPDANNLPNRSRADLYCEQMSLGTNATTTPTTTPTTTTPATTTNVTSPDDKGERDPANFARPPNTIRLEYSVSQNRNITEEQVKYSSSSSSDDLHSFYTKYLSSAGWVMTELHENDGGPKDTHQIYGHWIAKNNDPLDIRLSDLKPGYVEISISLKRSPPPDPRT